MPAEDAVEMRLGDALLEREETIAVAESCTGGLLGSRITDVPDASEYFVGGVISYMDQTKRGLLAIPRESLERHGAVSKPVAREMATHVRDEADADWALSTTGYAGEAAPSASEPAGTVYVGIASVGPGDEGPYSIVERHRFDGEKHEVKERVVQKALEEALLQVQAVQ